MPRTSLISDSGSEEFTDDDNVASYGSCGSVSQGFGFLTFEENGVCNSLFIYFISTYLTIANSYLSFYFYALITLCLEVGLKDKRY